MEWCFRCWQLVLARLEFAIGLEDIRVVVLLIVVGGGDTAGGGTCDIFSFPGRVTLMYIDKKRYWLLQLSW